jgi:hypothetical protein
MSDGQKLGFQLTPGKASGSKPLQQIEAWMEGQPETSGGFNAIKAQNQTLGNSLAAKAIGVNASELSGPVLQRADDQIGAVFDRARALPSVPINPDTAMHSLAGIEKEFEGQYLGNQTVSDNPLFKRALQFAADGSSDGNQIVTLSSNLGKAARTQMSSQSGDRAMGLALYKVKDLVDQSLQDAAPQGLYQDLAEARGQYRTLMNLTSRNTIINPSSGNVNLQALARALQTKDRGGFTMGGNESGLYTAAHFAQAFPDLVGDSGTATRSAGNLTALGLGAKAAGAVASRLYMSPAMQAVVGGSAVPATMLAKGLLKAPQGTLPAIGTAAGANLVNAAQ